MESKILAYVNLTIKYNRLQSTYNTFMKGRNGKNLEESLKEKFGEIDSILKVTKQNRIDIKDLTKKLDKNFQKTGIVKYVKGESYVELAEEEAEALDKAIFDDYEKEIDNIKK